MKKGFTLIELLVVVSILLILASLVVGVIKAGSNLTTEINAMVFPEAAQAQASQKLAEEVRIQNDLLRRQIELQEKSR